MKYGMLTVLDVSRDEENKVLCRCDCGTEKKIWWYNLNSGNTSSCGCLKKTVMSVHAKKRFTNKRPANFVDFQGKKIGMITVLGRTKDCRKYTTTYEILCECGTKSTSEISTLRRSKYLTCECGPANHPLRNVLIGMNQRCFNPSHPSFKFYGAKGINVCEEWKKYPIKFIEWSLQNGWKEWNGIDRKQMLVIDRIDSTKNYSPENCQWITYSENSIRAMKTRWEKGLSEEKCIRFLEDRGYSIVKRS